MRRSRTRIVSIFGQIEGTVALAMASEKKVHLIPVDMIPPTVRYNDAGMVATCALVLTDETEHEFDTRVAMLRS